MSYDSPSFSTEASAANLRKFRYLVSDLIKQLQDNAQRNHFYINRTIIHDIRSVKAFVEYVFPEISTAADSELKIETFNSNLESHKRIIQRLETYQKILAALTCLQPTRNQLTTSALADLYQEQPGKCGIYKKEFHLSLPQLLVLCSTHSYYLCNSPNCTKSPTQDQFGNVAILTFK